MEGIEARVNLVRCCTCLQTIGQLRCEKEKDEVGEEWVFPVKAGMIIVRNETNPDNKKIVQTNAKI